MQKLWTLLDETEQSHVLECILYLVRVHAQTEILLGNLQEQSEEILESGTGG